MNKADITVTGFVANELEPRPAGDHTVVEVTVPHTPRKFDKARNQWLDAGDTTWFQATFWDEHATAVLTMVEKGSLVSLSGTAVLEVFAKRDGTPGGRVKVMNAELAVVVRRPRKGEQQIVTDELVVSAQAAGAAWAAQSAPAIVDNVVFPDSEVPF